MNLIDYILLSLIFLAVTFVIISFVKKKKKGIKILSCNHDCQNCNLCEMEKK